MKVIDVIKESKKTLFSIEIVPPLRGHTLENIYKRVDSLVAFDPAFINVTYHKDEVVRSVGADGQSVKRVLSKRPGTVALTASLQQRYQVQVVPHLTCGGFTKDEVENALIDFHFLGVRNILALQGDPGRGKLHFEAEPGGHRYAVELIEQITNLNQGKYLDESMEQAYPTDFSVGAAGYPEKHFAAASMDEDLKHLKAKVDAGADYIVTQMFFDNQVFFDFVDQCRAIGIEVPIIPGLKPMAMKNQLEVLPRLFHLTLPPALCEEVTKCKTDQEVMEVGTHWSIQQAKELMEYGVPVLHFYTLGAGTSIARIAKAIF